MTITDEELLNYCDGTLDEQCTARIQEAIRHDTELAYRAQAMKASKLPYQAAFSQQPVPHVPESLVTRVHNMVKQSKAYESIPVEVNQHDGSSGFSRPSWHWGSIAASLAICFLLGYSMASHQYNAEFLHSLPVKDSQAEWVRRVADYQTLYVENTIADVEVSIEDTKSLLNRIEGAGVLRAELPDLSVHGYAFVRAQELGYRGETLVQLVYEKPGVAPLALCYMPSSDKQSARLTIGVHEELRTADWIDNGQRFVIVGEEPAEVMQSLYEIARKRWI